jgi:hypothetical protein
MAGHTYRRLFLISHLFTRPRYLASLLLVIDSLEWMWISIYWGYFYVALPRFSGVNARVYSGGTTRNYVQQSPNMYPQHPNPISVHTS